MSEDRIIDLYFDPKEKREVDEKYPGLNGLVQSGEWALYWFLSNVITKDREILQKYSVEFPDIISEDEYPFLTLMLKGQVVEANEFGGSRMPTTSKEFWAKLAGICKSISDLFEESSKGCFEFMRLED